MFFYILIAFVAAAFGTAIITNARDRKSFGDLVGYSLLTLLVAGLFSGLIFLVVSAVVGSAPATKMHVATETYTVAPNSKFDSSDGKLKFVYLKEGTLETYSNWVSEIHLSKDSGKTVEIDVSDNFYPGWAPFPYSSTRSATLR